MRIKPNGQHVCEVSERQKKVCNRLPGVGNRGEERTHAIHILYITCDECIPTVSLDTRPEYLSSSQLVRLFFAPSTKGVTRTRNRIAIPAPARF